MSIWDRIRKIREEQDGEKSWKTPIGDFLKKHKLLFWLIIAALVAAPIVYAVVVSNILQGTVTPEQPLPLQISFQTGAGLPPYDSSTKYVGQYYWLNITVQNSQPPLNGFFRLNFSRAGIAGTDLDVQYCGPPPGSSCTVLGKVITGNSLIFTTPTEAFPSGTSVRTFKVKFNVAQTFNYQIWVEGS